jgi:hypothetical protein
MTLALRFASGSSLDSEMPAFVALGANLSDKKPHAIESHATRRTSDVRLLANLDALVSSQRACMADIVAHLAELDSRPAVLARGYPSLFQYCLEHLHFSEDEACRRIEAARLSRRFPAILAELAAGNVTLSSLALLKPHITVGNSEELLAGIAGRSCRSTKEWLAAQFPTPDLPERIRQLPARTGSAGSGLVQPDPGTTDTSRGAELASGTIPLVLASPPGLATDARRSRLEPLSQDRFALQVTISRALKDELELVRDLMRHCNPNGDLERVLADAIAALRSKLEKERFGATKKPRSNVSRAPSKGPKAVASRHIPSEIKRAIVAKEGLRCSFVGLDGRRCECRAFLEFDHVEPVALAGGHGEGNVRIFCRAHNQYAAARIYGPTTMRRWRSSATRASPAPRA